MAEAGQEALAALHLRRPPPLGPPYTREDGDHFLRRWELNFVLRCAPPTALRPRMIGVIFSELMSVGGGNQTWFAPLLLRHPTAFRPFFKRGMIGVTFHLAAVGIELDLSPDGRWFESRRIVVIDNPHRRHIDLRFKKPWEPKVPVLSRIN